MSERAGAIVPGRGCSVRGVPRGTNPNARVRSSAQGRSPSVAAYHRFAAILVAGAFVLTLFAVSSHTAATALPRPTTVTVNDPTSDVKKGTPAWEDLVSAAVSGNGVDNFTFNLTTMAPMPAAPPFPNGTQKNDNPQFEWWFGLIQPNGSFAAKGWPDPGNRDPTVYYLVLFWDGSNFAAALANRTPLVHDAPVVLTPISFRIQGANVSFSAAPTALGGWTSFEWHAATEFRGYGIVQIVSSTDLLVLPANESYNILDADPTPTLASWP
ncbi:MAG TPA: hypothetical protein VFF67_00825 [Thermoplasmata archaeon]|nr:hypothetical protein [Thermoplasmata archaeon]